MLFTLTIPDYPFAPYDPNNSLIAHIPYKDFTPGKYPAGWKAVKKNNNAKRNIPHMGLKQLAKAAKRSFATS